MPADGGIPSINGSGVRLDLFVLSVTVLCSAFEQYALSAALLLLSVGGCVCEFVFDLWCMTSTNACIACCAAKIKVHHA